MIKEAEIVFKTWVVFISLFLGGRLQVICYCLFFIIEYIHPLLLVRIERKNTKSEASNGSCSEIIEVNDKRSSTKNYMKHIHPHRYTSPP